MRYHLRRFGAGETADTDVSAAASAQRLHGVIRAWRETASVGGYSKGLYTFSADGALLKDTVVQQPEGLHNYFYGGFQLLKNGHLVLANWTATTRKILSPVGRRSSWIRTTTWSGRGTSLMAVRSISFWSWTGWTPRGFMTIPPCAESDPVSVCSRVLHCVCRSGRVKY
jgi:hypothetical protein